MPDEASPLLAEQNSGTEYGTVARDTEENIDDDMHKPQISLPTIVRWRPDLAKSTLISTYIVDSDGHRDFSVRDGPNHCCIV
jgi:hypothetical protein